MQVATNSDLTVAYLERLTVDQLPFALALGINKTMTDVREIEIRREYDRTFKRRSENFFKHTHAIFRADKRQVKKTGGLHGAIQASHLPPPPGIKAERIAAKGKPAKPGQIARHITGGTRTPIKARSVAVPSTKRKKPVSRTASGAIRPNQRPKKLLLQPTVFVSKPDEEGRRFIMRRTASARKGIESRKKKRMAGEAVRKVSDPARKVETLFALLPRTKIRPTYRLMQAATPAFHNRLPLNLGSSIGRALRTAKPVKAGGVSVGLINVN